MSTPGDTNGQRAVLALVALATTLAAACVAPSTPAPRRTEAIELRGGSQLELPAPADIDRELRDGRTSLRTPDGVRVVIQEAPVDDRDAEGRTPQRVAAAITERVDLGEREGQLTHQPCVVATRAAECIRGWTVTADGDRLSRQGVVLSVGDRVVWIDVSGPEELDGEVETRANEILSALRVQEVSS